MTSSGRAFRCRRRCARAASAESCGAALGAAASARCAFGATALRRAAPPRPARGRSHCPCRAPSRSTPAATRRCAANSDSAADGRGAARRRAASASACSPRTCTSARPDAARGRRRPSLASSSALIGCAARGLQQRIVVVGFGRVDVERSSARHCSRPPARPEAPTCRASAAWRLKRSHPGELVVELRTGLRVAVRRIERGDQHAVDRGLDVAALVVGRIARQLGARDDRRRAARQDRDAVPGLLPAPDRAVARPPDRIGGKFGVAAFSSCRHTTSGFAARSQASRLGRRG